MLAVWVTGRRPKLEDVFFALALLRLPQLYMGIFFMRAVEATAELVASLRRLDDFLGMEEPPPPPSQLRPALQPFDAIVLRAMAPKARCACTAG